VALNANASPRAIAGVSLALALSFPAWANFTGRVVGIADGDTVTVLDAANVQHKVRLTGIDAPEKKQPFDSRSKQSLSDMVFNKIVTVESDKRDQSAADRQIYAAAEHEAEDQRRGLWTDAEPLPPWEWRKSRRR